MVAQRHRGIQRKIVDAGGRARHALSAAFACSAPWRCRSYGSFTGHHSRVSIVNTKESHMVTSAGRTAAISNRRTTQVGTPVRNTQPQLLTVFCRKETNVKPFFARKFLSIMLMGVFVLAPLRSASARYTEEARRLVEHHLAWDLGFDRARAVKRVEHRPREDAIRGLVPVLSDILGVGEDTPYNAEEVIQTRREMLANPRSGAVHEERETSGGTVVESEDGTAIIQDGVFNLRVYNGHAFNVSNRLNGYARNGNREAYLGDEEAKGLALAFIRKHNLVPSSEMDQLVFQRTGYVRFTGQVTDPYDRVVSTTAQFARSLNGIPVFGGSRIKIEFGAGRAITSMYVDWPPIEMSDLELRPVTPEQFDRRLSGQLESELVGKSENQQQIQVNVQTRLCGYLDPGPRSRFVQMDLACVTGYTLGDSGAPAVVVTPLAADGASTQEPFDSDTMKFFDTLGADPLLTHMFRVNADASDL